MFKKAKRLPSFLSENRRTIFFLFIVLLVVTTIRVRLISMPLERDEGEFGYGAQMLLQGLSPYKYAYNVGLKFPGTCGMYALAMVLFGQTPTGIHLIVVLANVATMLLMFFITRRICGDGGGIVAAGVYGLLSICPTAAGLAAHATHFVMLFALAGTALIQNVNERTPLSRIFWAGLLFGLSLMMKQTGAIFGIFAAVWVAYCEFISGDRNMRRLILRWMTLACGGLLPFLLTSCVIAWAGDWRQFILWAFTYAGAHASILSVSMELQTAANETMEIFTSNPSLWILGIIGFVLLFVENSFCRWRFFILSFVVVSVLAVYPAWRGHYFIQAFGAIAMLAGVAWRGSFLFLQRIKIPFPAIAVLLPIFLAAATSTLVQWSGVYFFLNPVEACRAIYPENPFPESVEIARYLQEHCPPDGKVAILGSEPQIYFYSHRRAATGFICTFPLMEPQPFAEKMQHEMAQQIEEAAPDYVVFVNNNGSWLRLTSSNPFIFDWFDHYRREHLQIVGLVELGPDKSEFHWFNSSDADVTASTKKWIAILKKRNE